MWSEATDSLTLISIGNNGAGNSDSCDLDASSPAAAVRRPSSTQRSTASSAERRRGGNCLSDNFIATENGDIYFFSPEQLDGSRGIPNQENLYVYRNGKVQYVTTLTPAIVLLRASAKLIRRRCSDSRWPRMQVTPDDSHMAFVTASQVTQYDNAGHLEMYTYEARDAGRMICVSCIPSGAPPTSDVAGRARTASS